MIQDIIRHKLDYSILAIFSTIFIILFLSFQTDPQALLIGTMAYGVAYVFWGIYHHLRLGNLRPKVILEYLLISLFAVLLVATLLI